MFPLYTVAIVFFSQQGKKPYKDLDAAQIVSAKVLLTPPDKTIEIENIQELVEYLNDVVVYNEDNSYTEYAGQGVVFTLTMVDGTQTDIMAYNPFIVIDGIGYKTKYEPCEALNSYANELLNSGTANIILEEPPTLSVVSDETAIGAVLGTYSWQKTNIDGTAESTIADSPHPLECKDLLSPPFETTETTATLRFTEDPDTILSVQCWSDEHWGEPATNSEDVTIVGNVLTLKLGGCRPYQTRGNRPGSRQRIGRDSGLPQSENGRVLSESCGEGQDRPCRRRKAGAKASETERKCKSSLRPVERTGKDRSRGCKKAGRTEVEATESNQ